MSLNGLSLSLWQQCRLRIYHSYYVVAWAKFVWKSRKAIWHHIMMKCGFCLNCEAHTSPMSVEKMLFRWEFLSNKSRYGNTVASRDRAGDFWMPMRNRLVEPISTEFKPKVLSCKTRSFRHHRLQVVKRVLIGVSRWEAQKPSVTSCLFMTSIS